MLNKLWLDDYRPAPEGWTWHFHVDDMIDDIRWLMSHGETFFFFSFVFVLGDREKEGYKVLDWLESLQKPVDFSIHIHSANPVARERMRAIRRNGWKEIL